MREDIGCRVISFGGGVQSTCLLYMAALGEFLPKADFAIFADTGWEPPSVYENVERVKKFCFDKGLPVLICTAGNLRDDILNSKTRFASIPLFTQNKDGTGGMLRRQCTREYKIEPICKTIREMCGISKGEHMQFKVDMWIGISYDEIERMSDSRITWQNLIYPLIDLKMTRQDCIEWMKDNDFPIPSRSSCIGCPYHSRETWREMKEFEPELFKDACDFDNQIRDFHLTKRGGVTSKLYIHTSRKPLDEAVDTTPSEEYTSECGGYCFT